MGVTEDTWLTAFFRWHGRRVAARPVVYMVAAILCTAALGMVVLVMYLKDDLRNYIDTDPNLVWVPPGSPTALQKKYFDAEFDPFFRISQIIVTLDGSAGDASPQGILRRDYFNALLGLQNKLYTTPASDGITTLNDVCFKPVPGQGCLVETPLDYFFSDPDVIGNLTDDSIQQFIACAGIDPSELPCSPGGSIQCPYKRLCFNALGIPLQQDVVLGGIGVSTANNSASICTPPISATALVFTFLLNGKTNSPTPSSGVSRNGGCANMVPNACAAMWEQDVFLKLVEEFSGNCSSKTSSAKCSSLGLRVTYMAERSISDQLEIVDTQNQYVVVYSYAAMLLYIALALGKFPHPIAMRANLALQGICIVGGSVAAALGIVFLCGWHITMIVTEVVPFLILAIG